MKYFPPLTQPMRSRIRKAVKESKGEADRHQMVSALCNEISNLTPFSTRLTDDYAIVKQSGYDIHFPRKIPPVKFVLIAHSYLDWLKRKYSMPGFCEVEEGDIVFDCGAYVGGFSMSSAAIAEKVYSFEPAPLNFECLEHNASQFSNMQPCAMGLGQKNETLELNLSGSSVEHSFLTPDRGASAGKVQVDVRRIDEFMSESGINRLDFLKIEAEGFEIEVFQGLGDVLPNKIAIDISPERNQESPSVFFEKALSESGYDINRRGNVLFGLRKK